MKIYQHEGKDLTVSIKEELHTLVDQLGDEDATEALVYLRRLQEDERDRDEGEVRIMRNQDARPLIMAGRAFFAQPRIDLATLAAQQQVHPITGFDTLIGDFWPEDETADEFIAAVREWRREGSNARA